MQNQTKINEKITIGGALEAGDAQKLHDEGFKTVISLLTADEENPSEKADVESVGLDFESVPVAPDLLDDVAVARFSQEVESSDGPVYVHCKSGGRAGVMTLLHLGVKHGLSLEETLKMGEKFDAKVGEDSPYRAFFESYLQRHSAGER